MSEMQILCSSRLYNTRIKGHLRIPILRCANYEDQHCNFVLHEWCTRLPDNLPKYPGHPEHTLTFYSNIPSKFMSVFVCGVCSLPCYGFVYSCIQCDYHIDVNCGFIPEKVAHEAHSDHILDRVMAPTFLKCILCLNVVPKNEMTFQCMKCRECLHTKCAFLLPSKIRHKYDKHILSLSYLPIENHKSQYFCEICEEEFNPRRCFYHCKECKQSFHSCCGQFILESETATSSSHDVGVYEFVNIKFGAIHKIQNHPHDLSWFKGLTTTFAAVSVTTRCSHVGVTFDHQHDELILCDLSVNINI
ncbi:uncharacterized protein [Rutidosis leptorrhynchoides]|uniref:uncharacterized protein n=1 Tax=Rutidosis leptorrhynchoides TaxID=125765 RepID=UPI003A9A3BA5